MWQYSFPAPGSTGADGSVYSAVAPDAIQFILSRAVVGSGFGLALMASQGFVITHTDDRNKTQGLAHMFAGLYAGSICGGAAGAMLAEYYGYSFVFLLGAGVIVLAIGYTLYFMSEREEVAPRTDIKIAQTFKAADLRAFLFNRNVLSLVFFSSLPAAIAVVGFLNYFSPIYLNRMGASESTIGQILIIYGICLILAGPTIGKFVDASNDKKSWIFVGCLLGSAAFLVFTFFDGVPATMLAILLLGLSSSFVLSSQTSAAAVGHQGTGARQGDCDLPLDQPRRSSVGPDSVRVADRRHGYARRHRGTGYFLPGGGNYVFTGHPERQTCAHAK